MKNIDLLDKLFNHVYRNPVAKSVSLFVSRIAAAYYTTLTIRPSPPTNKFRK